MSKERNSVLGMHDRLRGGAGDWDEMIWSEELK